MPDGGALTIVLKLGSSSIVHPEPPFVPQIAVLAAIVETCVSLRALGHRVVIVSSGAIAMGRHRLEYTSLSNISSGGGTSTPSKASSSKRSAASAMGEKQALAAIGQGRLIALWDQLFATVKQPIAQILMTRNDIADRSRYMNATTTFSSLLSMGVIPIVNENDTISVSEILHVNKFGDNDTLSAIAAGMCRADYLFLLTDVEGLYQDNPRKVPGAKRVAVVNDIDQVRKLVSTSTLGTSLGTGGMETKLIAAELATAAGCATVITLGSDPSRILSIVSSPSPERAASSTSTLPGVEFYDPAVPSTVPPHTLFMPKPRPLSSRRFWILHGLTPRGTVYVDEGAYNAISSKRSITTSSLGTGDDTKAKGLKQNSGAEGSEGRGNGGRLLPAGVVCVEGTFAAGQAVRVCVIKGRKGVSHRRHSSSKRRRRRSRRLPDDPDPNHEHHDDDYDDDDDDDDDDDATHSDSSNHGDTKHHNHHHEDESDPNGPLVSSTSSLVITNDSGATSLQLRPGEQVVEFGRGLTNYNSLEIDRVKGLPSSEIERVLGYVEAEHVVESVVELKPVVAATAPPFSNMTE